MNTSLTSRMFYGLVLSFLVSLCLVGVKWSVGSTTVNLLGVEQFDIQSSSYSGGYNSLEAPFGIQEWNPTWWLQTGTLGWQTVVYRCCTLCISVIELCRTERVACGMEKCVDSSFPGTVANVEGKCSFNMSFLLSLLSNNKMK